MTSKHMSGASVGSDRIYPSARTSSYFLGLGEPMTGWSLDIGDRVFREGLFRAVVEVTCFEDAPNEVGLMLMSDTGHKLYTRIYDDEVLLVITEVVWNGASMSPEDHRAALALVEGWGA